MWYRYFNKNTWNIRVWRGLNLKYNQDDYGMTRFKFNALYKDLIFRIFRNENTIRSLNIFAAIGWLPILGYLTSKEVDPQAVIDAEKKEAGNDWQIRTKFS